MGCTGNGALHYMSQVCLITFTVRRTVPPKLRTGYARQIFIKTAIDFNCVINRHTDSALSIPLLFISILSLYQ